MINQKELTALVAEGATLLAVYRLREDGDGDFIALFDIENCAERFADNTGDGAAVLAAVVQAGLADDGEEAVWVCFQRMADVVDILEGAQERWEAQREKPHNPVP